MPIFRVSLKYFAHLVFDDDDDDGDDLFFSWTVAVDNGISQENQPRLGCPTGDQPINRVNTTTRLQQLRVAMSAVKLVRGAPLKAYIITSDDEHQVYHILS